MIGIASLWNRSRPLWNHIRRRVAIDTRSLAVFRIGIAVLIIADLLSRSRNFQFYYTDDGVVSQSVAQWWTGDAFSVFYYTSDPTLIAALFILHGLVAVQLLVGYHTRIAAVVSFLFVVSLDHHNPLVLSYADTLFRFLCFWAIFLPLGERWAIDAVHRERSPRREFVGLAGLFALLQLILMYFVNGVNKYPSELWRTGEGTPLVFGIDEMTFLLGDTMRQFPTLLEFGGQLWFFMLLVSPLLLLLRDRWRLPLVGLFMGGHLAFALTVRIGAFPYVALVGLLLFLQLRFWTLGRNALQRSGLAAVVSGTATRLRNVATEIPRYQVDSTRYRPAARATYQLSVGIIAVSLLIVIATILLSVGGVIHADAETTEEQIVFAVEETPGVQQIEATASHFGVEQPGWSIFAGPDPRTSDRYYVFAAETTAGEQVDLYFNRELSYERPYQQLNRQHRTYRMRFYMNSIRRGSSPEAQELLATYLCEQWADTNDTAITHLNMYTVREEITRETISTPADRDRRIDLFYKTTCSTDDEPTEFAPPPDDF